MNNLNLTTSYFLYIVSIENVFFNFLDIKYIYKIIGEIHNRIWSICSITLFYYKFDTYWPHEDVLFFMLAK